MRKKRSHEKANDVAANDVTINEVPEESVQVPTGDVERIYLFVTMVERGLADKLIQEMRKLGITYNMSSVGYAAVGLDIADYLGLSDHAADVIFSVVPESKRKIAFSMIEYRFSLDKVGTGMSFIVPISGVGGPVSLKYISGIDPDWDRL